jgi:hypothetical protein
MAGAPAGREDRPMSSTHPKNAKDLALAPVAVQVDENLRYLRSCTAAEVPAALELMLNAPERDDERSTRERRVLAAALRDVDLHGWDAALTDDGSAIRLTGGSVSLDIAVGASLLHHLEQAVPATSAG